jgi:hypothetical protein
MHFFYVPTFKMHSYEARLIKSEYENNQWSYSRFCVFSGTSHVEVPAEAPIYKVEKLDELILLAHSEPIERNGLTILFVQKGTMELIHPVQIQR